MKTENKRFQKGFQLKRLWVWALWDVKFIRSGLYGEDRDENYFIIICILKLIKSILKLQDKFRKDDRNDMVVDVAQRFYK